MLGRLLCALFQCDYSVKQTQARKRRLCFSFINLVFVCLAKNGRKDESEPYAHLPSPAFRIKSPIPDIEKYVVSGQTQMKTIYLLKNF